jgi:hypothetical protein
MLRWSRVCNILLLDPMKERVTKRTYIRDRCYLYSCAYQKPQPRRHPSPNQRSQTQTVLLLPQHSVHVLVHLLSKCQMEPTHMVWIDDSYDIIIGKHLELKISDISSVLLDKPLFLIGLVLLGAQIAWGLPLALIMFYLDDYLKVNSDSQNKVCVMTLCFLALVLLRIIVRDAVCVPGHRRQIRVRTVSLGCGLLSNFRREMRGLLSLHSLAGAILT